ncbi:sugar phosphate isomerase/epimerase family protein [Bacteroidota bacterium]
MINKKGLLFLAICVLMFSIAGCNSTKNKLKIVESWKKATSVGSINKLSEEKFDELVSYGFTDIEVGIGRIRSSEALDNLKSNVKKTIALAEKKNINIWSIHIPYGRDIDISLVDISEREKAINEVILIIETCKELKPEKLVIHGSFEPVKDEERAERLKACKASLKILVRKANDYNMQIAVECLPRTCIGNTSIEMLSILKEVEGLVVCCDVNHMLKESPEEFINAVGSAIVTLHISDYDGIDERHWLPGEGIIKWNNVIENLVSAGFKGPFLFESKGSIEEKALCWDKLKEDYKLYLEEGNI